MVATIPGLTNQIKASQDEINRLQSEINSGTISDAGKISYQKLISYQQNNIYSAQQSLNQLQQQSQEVSNPGGGTIENPLPATPTPVVGEKGINVSITSGLLGNTESNVQNDDGTITTTTTSQNKFTATPPFVGTYVPPVLSYANNPDKNNQNNYAGTYGVDYVAVSNPVTYTKEDGTVVKKGDIVYTTPQSVRDYSMQSYLAPAPGVNYHFGETLSFQGVTTTTTTSKPKESEAIGVFTTKEDLINQGQFDEYSGLTFGGMLYDTTRFISNFFPGVDDDFRDEFAYNTKIAFGGAVKGNAMVFRDLPIFLLNTAYDVSNSLGGKPIYEKIDYDYSFRTKELLDQFNIPYENNKESSSGIDKGISNFFELDTYEPTNYKYMSDQTRISGEIGAGIILSAIGGEVVNKVLSLDPFKEKITNINSYTQVENIDDINYGFTKTRVETSKGNIYYDNSITSFEGIEDVGDDVFNVYSKSMSNTQSSIGKSTISPTYTTANQWNSGDAFNVVNPSAGIDVIDDYSRLATFGDEANRIPDLFYIESSSFSTSDANSKVVNSFAKGFSYNLDNRFSMFRGSTSNIPIEGVTFTKSFSPIPEVNIGGMSTAESVNPFGLSEIKNTIMGATTNLRASVESSNFVQNILNNEFTTSISNIMSKVNPVILGGSTIPSVLTPQNNKNLPSVNLGGNNNLVNTQSSNFVIKIDNKDLINSDIQKNIIPVKEYKNLIPVKKNTEIVRIEDYDIVPFDKKEITTIDRRELIPISNFTTFNPFQIDPIDFNVGGGFTPLPLIPIILPKVNLPGGGGRKRGSITNRFKRKTGYVASFSAGLLNIRGKPNLQKSYTGLEVRPLIGKSTPRVKPKKIVKSKRTKRLIQPLRSNNNFLLPPLKNNNNFFRTSNRKRVINPLFGKVKTRNKITKKRSNKSFWNSMRL